MSTPDADETDRKQLGSYYAMAQVGIEMVVPIGLGWWADEQLGTGPWLLVLGVILGFSIGILHLLRVNRRVDAAPPKEPKS